MAVTRGATPTTQPATRSHTGLRHPDGHPNHGRSGSPDPRAAGQRRACARRSRANDRALPERQRPAGGRGHRSARRQRPDGRSPIQYRGPGPERAARSPGFASRRRSSERQPHPMHSVSPCFSRSNSAIRSSSREVHALDSRAQSRRVGAAPPGSLLSSSRISLRERPILCAKTIESDAPEHRPRITTVAGAGSGRRDQAPLLFGDGEHLTPVAACHAGHRRAALTSSALELVEFGCWCPQRSEVGY